MKRLLLITVCSLCALSVFAQNARMFEVTYVATVRDIPAGLKSLDLWIPLCVGAATGGWQWRKNRSEPDVDVDVSLPTPAPLLVAAAVD